MDLRLPKIEIPSIPTRFEMAALITPYATLSFPVLFSPKPRSEGGEPVYSCSLLFSEASQRTKEWKAIQEAARNAALEKFGDKVNMSSILMPFRDAGEKADKYEGYEAGVIYLSPWTKQKPGIVDARRQDILLPEEIYAGQIVRAQINPFAWTNSGKKGVSFGLNNLQIVKADAPRIDGRAAAKNVFDEVDDGSPASPF